MDLDLGDCDSFIEKEKGCTLCPSASLCVYVYVCMIDFGTSVLGFCEWLTTGDPPL